MGSNNATLQQVIPTSYWMGSTKNIDSSQSNFVSSKIPSHPQLFFKKCIYMQSHLSIYLSTLLIFLTKIFIFIIKIRINTTKFTTLKTKKKKKQTYLDFPSTSSAESGFLSISLLTLLSKA